MIFLKYLRQGFGTNLDMDSLTYNYTYSAGRLSNNKLNYVRDRINNSVAHSSNYTEDIDDQAGANYTYDLIGNLTRDNAESITSIVWNVYGKITQIVRTATANNPLTNIQYTYDAAGNRISKRVAKTGTTTIEYTWYARDAQGNVMATYNSTGTGSFSTYPVSLTEQHLYGSSRLGVVNRIGVNMKTSFALGNYRSYIRGDKFYELNNHLDNVLSVISDKKNGTAQSGNPTLIDYYTADIVSASDYAPFGMQMVGRKFDVGKFRYGFNGKENDNEVKGGGNQQDYGMRIYDPRLGRFLSVDPLTGAYPWYTPYQYAGNKPIRFIDLDGEEEAAPAVFKQAMDKISNFFEDDSRNKSKWTSISKVDFVSTVTKTLMTRGYNVHQGHGWFCGPAAVIHLFVNRSPVKYVENMIRLYEEGYMLSTDGTKIYAKKSMLDQGINSDGTAAGISDMNINDYMLMGTIRNHQNDILGCDPATGGEIACGSWPTEMEGMIERYTGLQVTTSKITSFGGTYNNSDYFDIENAVNTSKGVMLFGDFSQWDYLKKTLKDQDQRKSDKLTRVFGRHYRVLKSFSFEQGTDGKVTSVTLTYWDYGKSKKKVSESTVTLSREDFEGALRAIFITNK